MIDHNARQILFQKLRDKELSKTITDAFGGLKDKLSVPDKPDLLSKPIKDTSESAQNQAVLQAFTVSLLQEMNATLKEILKVLATKEVTNGS